MCGIVGYIGSQSALKVVIEGLARLEYRGYDSAGIAVVTKEGKLEVHPEAKEAMIEVTLPDAWPSAPPPTAYKLHEEFVIGVPDGQIRLKVLRFRPRPDGTTTPGVRSAIGGRCVVRYREHVAERALDPGESWRIQSLFRR